MDLFCPFSFWWLLFTPAHVQNWKYVSQPSCEAHKTHPTPPNLSSNSSSSLRRERTPRHWFCILSIGIQGAHLHIWAADALTHILSFSWLYFSPANLSVGLSPPPWPHILRTSPLVHNLTPFDHLVFNIQDLFWFLCVYICTRACKWSSLLLLLMIFVPLT